jgi:hypothetical protein
MLDPTTSWAFGIDPATLVLSGAAGTPAPDYSRFFAPQAGANPLAGMSESQKKRMKRAAAMMEAQRIPLEDRIQIATDATGKAIGAAMLGANIDELTMMLGGRQAKGATGLAKAIKAYAQISTSKKKDPAKLKRAEARIQYAMIPFIAFTPEEEKLGHKLFKARYGVSHPSKIKGDKK